MTEMNEINTEKKYKLRFELNMNGHSNESVQKPLPVGVPFDDYQPPNWDELFMLKVYLTGSIR